MDAVSPAGQLIDSPSDWNELANPMESVPAGGETKSQAAGEAKVPARSAGLAVSVFHLSKTSQPDSKQAVASHVADL